MPQVLPRISADQWRRVLKIVYDKDEALTIESREIRMNPFIRKLMGVLKEGSEETINYTLNELSDLQNRTSNILRRGPVDLETFVLDSIKSNFDRFNVEDLSSLHTLFLDMYHERESFFPEANKYFNDFVASIGEVPQSLTSESINEAKKIIRKKSLNKSRKTAHGDDKKEREFWMINGKYHRDNGLPADIYYDKNGIKRREIWMNKKSEVREILNRGRDKAKQVAAGTLAEAMKAMGIRK